MIYLRARGETPHDKGIVVYNGVEYQGKHEPMVDDETWQRVQDSVATAERLKATADGAVALLSNCQRTYEDFGHHERRLMNQAAGIVTVSEPWADIYRAKYGRPTRAIYNGYDPEDLPQPAPQPQDGPLTILYAGAIYPGRRDPSRAVRPTNNQKTVANNNNPKMAIAMFGKTQKAKISKAEFLKMTRQIPN